MKYVNSRNEKQVKQEALDDANFFPFIAKKEKKITIGSDAYKLPS